AQSSSTANTHRAAAATQASAASESATQAAAARDAAKQSQTAAKTSETNAASHKKAAATSASNAATSETNAGASATASASSAAEAKGHADRAEVASDPEGLRNEMTKQFAALVDGAPEDLDTIREIAEYAQSNRGITDQLNAAIGDKANKTHTHRSSDITDTTNFFGSELGANRIVRTHEDGQLHSSRHPTANNHLARKGYVDDEVAKKADSSHKHTSADITDATDWINHSSHPSKVVRTREDGFVHGNSPTEDRHVSTKGYVDVEVAKKANKSHTHAQSDITGLSTALNNKAAKTHSHTTADITNFATEMGKKA